MWRPLRWPQKPQIFQWSPDRTDRLFEKRPQFWAPLLTKMGRYRRASPQPDPRSLTCRLESERLKPSDCEVAALGALSAQRLEDQWRGLSRDVVKRAVLPCPAQSCVQTPELWG